MVLTEGFEPTLSTYGIKLRRQDRYVSMEINMIVECKTCLKTFDKKVCEIKKTKNNFCTSSCAAKFNNLNKCKNPQKERKCFKCSNNFYNTRIHQNKKYCLLCYKPQIKTSELAKNSTIEEYQNMYSVKNKHPSWKKCHIRNFNRSWNKKLLKNPCQKCGYSNHIELAHFKAISD